MYHGVSWMGRKILILGSTGLLGQALMHEARKRYEVVLGAARKYADLDFDITDDNKLEQCIQRHAFDVIINCCAIVDHELCEQNTALAYRINARPSSIIANISKEKQIKYVYISTDGYYHGDYVQKHSEDNEILLLNEYARTKFLGEVLALTNPYSLVVRTNIVGFRNKVKQPTFVEWAINALQNSEEITLFEDYYTSSISVAQFSKALLDIIEKDCSGIINIASSQVASKREFIEELAGQFGFSLKNTKTGSVRMLLANRPDSLGLDVSKAESILGYRLPKLKEVIAQLKKEYDYVQKRNND